MVLRGQGDSPVRICEPCKKIEEAARFQLRHGHKGGSTKGQHFIFLFLKYAALNFLIQVILKLFNNVS